MWLAWPLWLASLPLWPRWAAAAIHCPDGYYQSEAIEFGCEGASGEFQYILEPHGVSNAVTIAAGIQNFSVTAITDLYVDLALYDPASHVIVGSNSDSAVGRGIYKGVSIEFSGDDIDKTNKSLRVAGSFPVDVALRLSNYHYQQATVALAYSHAGFAPPCPEEAQPHACRAYDEVVAREDVGAWSRHLRLKFEDAGEAWLVFGAEDARSAAGGVPWHRWPSVWAQSGMPFDVDDTRWQRAFHFLDADGDGEVSFGEFELAYHLDARGPPPARRPAAHAHEQAVAEGGMLHAKIVFFLLICAALMIALAASAMRPGCQALRGKWEKRTISRYGPVPSCESASLMSRSHSVPPFAMDSKGPSPDLSSAQQAMRSYSLPVPSPAALYSGVA